MQTEPWNQEQRQRGSNEVLTLGQRIGEQVSVFIIFLILGFYLYHQFANTGFFTTNFVGWAVFMFYGSFALSVLPALLRAVIGRRNPVRPFEAAFDILLAGAFIYLLVVFPFNFSHFSYALPEDIRFMFAWVGNDIAKVALVLATLGFLVSAAFNIVKYLTFRRN